MSIDLWSRKIVSGTVFSFLQTVREYSRALMDCHGERGARGEDDAGPKGRIAIRPYTGI